MKQIRVLTAALSLATLLPLGALGAVYINETFEDDAIGALPSDAAQKNVLQVTNKAGTGLIGTDNAAHFNDTIAGTGGSGDLEYNVGASALGNMYIQFDLLNKAPSNTGSAANPIIFGVGPWSASSGISLGANASRGFGVEFYQTGSSSTLKIRTNATTPLTTTYVMAAVQTVKIWVNDNDTTTLLYTRPDNATTATLGANSFVVWLNDSLVGIETDAGFGMNTGLVAGNTTGDATLGRLGFTSTTTSLADFWIDNIYVADAVTVPEPSSVSLLLGAGMLLAWRSRRRLAN